MCGFCFNMDTVYKVLSRYMFGVAEENHDTYEDSVGACRPVCPTGVKAILSVWSGLGHCWGFEARCNCLLPVFRAESEAAAEMCVSLCRLHCTVRHKQLLVQKMTNSKSDGVQRHILCAKNIK
jgi:hypothetical protein